MDVSVSSQRVDDIRYQLAVELSAGDVRGEFDRAYRDLERTTNLPGFRRGRAPRAVLEKKFGRALASELFERLIRTSLAEAVRREQLSVVGVTEVKTRVAEPGRELSFEATVEVLPTVVAADYAGIPVKKRAVSVTDADVDRALESVRENFAQWVPETARAQVAADDTVLVDYEVWHGAREIGRGASQQVTIGRSGFPKEVQEALVGTSVGEQFHRDSELDDPRFPGTVRFSVTVKGLLRKELPSLDDEFAKDHGECESLAELRERIRARIVAAAEQEADRDVREAVLRHLTASHEFLVPQALVDNVLGDLLGQQKQRWSAAGLPEQEQQRLLEQVTESARTVAADRAKLSLILDAIAEREHLEVSDADVDERYELLARQAEVPVERVRGAHADAAALARLRASLRQQKAVAFVLDRAMIEVVEQDAVVADDE